MEIDWRKEPEKYVYWYGSTPSRFSFEIGESNNAGRYMALVFHADFRYVVVGEEVESIDDAKQFCARWLSDNVKT